MQQNEQNSAEMVGPSRADDLRVAYERGLLPAEMAKDYEKAIERGLVQEGKVTPKTDNDLNTIEYAFKDDENAWSPAPAPEEPSALEVTGNFLSTFNPFFNPLQDGEKTMEMWAEKDQARRDFGKMLIPEEPLFGDPIHSKNALAERKGMENALSNSQDWVSENVPLVEKPMNWLLEDLKRLPTWSDGQNILDGLGNAAVAAPGTFIADPVGSSQNALLAITEPVSETISGAAGGASNVLQAGLEHAQGNDAQPYLDRAATNGQRVVENAPWVALDAMGMGPALKMARKVPEVPNNDLLPDNQLGLPKYSPPTAEQKASDLMLKALKNDSSIPDDLAKNAAKRKRAVAGRNRDMVFEQGGKNLKNLSRASASVTGPTADLAETALNKRAGMTFDDMSAAATKNNKGDNFRSEKQRIVDDYREQAKVHYQDFRASKIDEEVFDQRIAPTLGSDYGQEALEATERGFRIQANSARAGAIDADGNLLELTANEMDDLANAVALYRNGEVQYLPPAALDEVKKHFDTLIADSKGRTQTLLRSSKNAFAKAVDMATGGTYAKARQAFGSSKSIEDAFDLGAKATRLKARDLEDAIDELKKRNDHFGASEVDALATGYGRALLDMIEANDGAAAKRMLRDKRLQENFKTLLGVDAWKQFNAKVDRIVEHSSNRNFILGGSPTARIADDIAEYADEGVTVGGLRHIEEKGMLALGEIKNQLGNIVIKPSAKALRNLVTSMRHGGIKDEEVNRILGEWLFETAHPSKVNAIVEKLNKRLAEKKERKIFPKLPSGGAAKSFSEDQSGGVASETAASVAGGVAGAVGGYTNAVDLDGDGEVSNEERTVQAIGAGGLMATGARAIAKGPKALSEMDHSQKNVFGGVEAQNAPKDHLLLAQAMERQKYSPKEIHANTGWVKMGDGKWRFEIDDSKAKLHFEKLKAGFEANISPGKVVSTKLANVFSHEALFEQYPDLKEVKLIVSDAAKNTAHFDRRKNSITISSDKLLNHGEKSLRSTLIHELQHGIQKAEGFARGGSPRPEFMQHLHKPEWQSIWKDYLDDVYQIDKILGIDSSMNLTKFNMQKSGKNPTSREVYDEMIRQYSPDPRDLVSFDTWKRAQQPITDHYNYLKRYNAALEAEDLVGQSGLSHSEARQEIGFDNYLNLHGEAEARLAQVRAEQSPHSKEFFPLDEVDTLPTYQNGVWRGDYHGTNKRYSEVLDKPEFAIGQDGKVITPNH